MEFNHLCSHICNLTKWHNLFLVNRPKLLQSLMFRCHSLTTPTTSTYLPTRAVTANSMTWSAPTNFVRMLTDVTT